MRRLLWLVGAIVLIDIMFFAALTPLLPGYTDDLGLSKTSAGVLAASYAGGSFAGGIPSGLLASRVGVRATVLLGLVIVAATTVAFGFATNIWLLDAARFAQGLGSAFSWTGALAWLVAAAPPGRRGQLIGTALGTAIVGGLLGPVLGGAVSIVGPRTGFGAVALLELVLAAWAWSTPEPDRRAGQGLRTLFAALRHRRVLGGLWFVTLPGLLFGVLTVLAPLRLSELGFGSIAIGATFLTAAALEAAMSPLLGRLSDRRGRAWPIRLGLVASLVVAATLPWLQQAAALAAVVVLAGLAFGSFWTPGMALLSDGAEALGLDYALGFALMNLAWAPGQAGGAALGGTLAGLTSDAVPYLALSLVCALTLVLVLVRARPRPPHADLTG